MLVLGLWAWLSLKLAHRVSKHGAPNARRAWIKYLLFIGLLPLPLVDEIYSRSAFTRLCEAETKLVLLDPHIAGKTIWFTGGASLSRKIGLLRGREEQWTYVVANSETPAFRHSSFHVQGGWLMSALKISETGGPLLLASYCGGVDHVELWRRLNITVVDKPVR